MLKRMDLTHLTMPLTAIFIGLLIWARGSSQTEFGIVVIATIFYLSLTFVHHHFDKTLKFEILIEYVLIAVLVLIILQGLFI